jgi:hypothetical protein
MLRQGKVERTLDVKEKSLPAYLEYIQTLYNYLVSFFDRALPLTNIHQKIREEEEKFEAAWSAGQVEGWESEGPKKTAPTGEGIWCPFCKPTFLLEKTKLMIRSKELFEADCIRCSPQFGEAQEEGKGRGSSRRSFTSHDVGPSRFIILDTRKDTSASPTHFPRTRPSYYRTYSS